MVAYNLAKVDVRVRFPLPAPILMNVNDDLKTIWWLPTRTASRSVGEIVAHYNFYNHLSKLPCSQSYTHAIGIPDTCENYTIISNIRNPYAKVLSTWHLRCFHSDSNKDCVIDMPFSEFVQKHVSSNSEEHQIISQKKKPDIYIRTEHLVEDLKKVKFIDFENESIQHIMSVWINKNNYTSEGCEDNWNPKFDLKRDDKNPLLTDYLNYYTQKELDIVWEVYKDVFVECGYQREFIK